MSNKDIAARSIRITPRSTSALDSNPGVSGQVSYDQTNGTLRVAIGDSQSNILATRAWVEEGYISNTELNTALSSYVTNAALLTTLGSYATTTYVTNSISAIPPYVLPTATTSALGGVRVDGISITISNGVISSVSSNTPGSGITGTTLASNVVSSSLTSVGTLTGLTVNGNTILGNSSVDFTTRANGGLTAATRIAVYGDINTVNFGTTGSIGLRYANGTVGSPTSVLQDDRLGAMFHGGYHSALASGVGSWINPIMIASFVDGDPTSVTTAIPGRLSFFTTPINGSRTERLRIDSTGNVSIRTSNLTFNGTGQRITGDFTNATIASRTMFQTSTADSNTNVYAIPSGTGSIATWSAANSSDPNNASIGQLAATPTDIRVLSVQTGTGTLLPITFWAGGAERVRLDTSGNFGIGATTGLDRLTVRQDQNASTRAAINNQDANSSAESVLRLSAAGATWDIAAGSSAKNSNALTFGVIGSEFMRITSGGNVGVGGTATQRFQVFGGTSAQTRSTGDNLAFWGFADSTSNSYIRLQNTTGSIDYGQTNGAAFVNVNNNQPWYIATGGSERLRITSTGDVGINAAPGARLHVSTGNTDSTNGILVSGGITNKSVMLRPSMGIGNNNGIVQAGDGGIIFDGGTVDTGAFVIAPWASTTSGIRITNTGNVGIGTTSPGARLDVSGNIRLSAAGPNIEFNNGGAMIYGPAANTLAFATGGGPATPVERMRIDSAGRTTIPSQPGFYANGAAQNFVLGNQGDLVLANARYNVGSHYNTSTYRFTAPVAGRYLFTWSVFINTVAGRCSLKLNGGPYFDLQMDVGNGMSQSAILNLAAGDFVTVGDFQNISGLNYWGSHSHFSGILLA